VSVEPKLAPRAVRSLVRSMISWCAMGEGVDIIT
jgi:hypothetical protein